MFSGGWTDFDIVPYQEAYKNGWLLVCSCPDEVVSAVHSDISNRLMLDLVNLPFVTGHLDLIQESKAHSGGLLGTLIFELYGVKSMLVAA